MADLERDTLKRSIDLVEYARSRGYQEKPQDGIPGITVLEHERLHDRIAIARLAQGGIYARITDYHSRTPEEPDERARLRLRDCILRSKDTGSIVELVQHRERVAGRPAPSVKQVWEHLRAWQELQPGLAHKPDVAPLPLHRRMGDWQSSSAPTVPSESEVQERLRRWHDAQRAIDLKLGHATELSGPQHAPQPASRDVSRGAEKALSPGEVGGLSAGRAPSSPQHALGKRHYGLTPPIAAEPASRTPPLARDTAIAGPPLGEHNARAGVVLVVTQSLGQALLYYKQQGERLGHTNANATFLTVGSERPRGAGWDLRGVDKAIAAMPAGGSVVAALPGPPTGDRLAQELRILADRYPQVTFQRHTLNIERDQGLRAPDRQVPHPALQTRALGPSRGR